MDWKEYFKLSVMRETKDGLHPYYHSELKVSDNFSMDELLMREFDHLQLDPTEKKYLNVNLRKILLRHHYFISPEFKRIVDNFSERIASDKEKELIFNTSGGGIYIFLLLMWQKSSCFNDKKVICYTSELPINLFKLKIDESQNVRLIYKPGPRSYLRNLPSLWQNSHLIALFEVHEA